MSCFFYINNNFIITITTAPGIPKTPINIEVIKFNPIWKLKKEPIRLIGLRVDNLDNKDEIQLSIFENDEKQEKLDNVLDSLKNKYGYNSITRAGKLEVENIVKGKEKKIK